ncbi:cell wall metabolism sensor histidine kinase WalK [Anaerobacillus sp. MEB173]|uniref:cell wall metabolism sensor histidine kinase WalK n=1 Tax=Anaerobacillus sp. MEB173 TaxID=3383345 RepID=UPI003F90B22F
MKKVGFFKSIHVKLVLIYVLLILIAMQVIGVYFVRQLEEQLITNYFKMLDDRANLLSYNVEQEMIKTRDDQSPSLTTDIHSLLRDFFSIDQAEVQVIDHNKMVVGTSNLNNRHIIGQLSTEIRVKRALLGREDEAILRDPQTGHRVRVMAVPVKSNNDIIGAIYIEASIEAIYDQIKQINQIFATGTFIALTITALLGIILARTITRPIVDMRKHAVVMAKGDYSKNVRVYGDDEIGQLAMAFNNLTKKLEEAHATTEGERKKLSSVLAHMTDGVIATDKEGRIILMNNRAEDLLAVNRDAVLGASLLRLLHLSDTITLEELYESTEPILLDFGGDHRDYIVEAKFSVIQNGDGPVNGLIAVVHDVTEQEKIEQERREFVANVSHELRTPLTSLRSYLEALADGAMNDPDIAPRFLQVTQNETERMIRLVNDLLQFSKMDSKDYRLNFEEINLTEYVNMVIDRFEMVSKDGRITFEREIEWEDMYASVDRDKITQVLDNIISNAIKYSPEGGVITIGVHHDGQENIRITVTDQGLGIPRESINKIFDRFYRVDKARSRNLGGTGLGLAIAKEMVQAHGGEIWVESEWEKGTTISFTLPHLVRRSEDGA